jgi:hypothetical protein
METALIKYYIDEKEDKRCNNDPDRGTKSNRQD